MKTRQGTLVYLGHIKTPPCRISNSIYTFYTICRYEHVYLLWSRIIPATGSKFVKNELKK